MPHGKQDGGTAYSPTELGGLSLLLVPVVAVVVDLLVVIVDILCRRGKDHF